MSEQPSTPTASAEGPCPTVIQIVGRPGTGSLSSTTAAPDHPIPFRETGSKICTYSDMMTYNDCNHYYYEVSKASYNLNKKRYEELYKSEMTINTCVHLR